MSERTHELDPEERWREQPEAVLFPPDAGGFPLYYLLNPSGDEFENEIGVAAGVCSSDCDNPSEGDQVLLSITGSNGTRLANVLLMPVDARKLAKKLKQASKAVGPFWPANLR